MDDSWYQFVSEQRDAVDGSEQQHPLEVSGRQEDIDPSGLGCSSNLDEILRRRRRSSSPTSLKVSTASIAVILPEKDYNPSLEILRSFSSDSMQAINKSQSADPDFDRGLRSATSAVNVEPAQIPRRNLTEAFEELYIKPSKSWSNNVTDSPDMKQLNGFVRKNIVSGTSNMISPTGVTELDTAATVESAGTTLTSLADHPSNLVTPIKVEPITKTVNESLDFRLHPQLQRDMSDHLVQRVSMYAIIHDINKEATSMAANDDSGYNRNPEEVNENYDPLIMAVYGLPRLKYTGPSSFIKMALIDEERWLLDAIDSRNPEETRSIKACPPTFLQAMGERDYENPLTSISNGSRTQLWKPSRSWWEAKSGKNPWIEPQCHNRRWRYLWPLIHYHKFLAKCIKKLKRNGVCVKSTVSPVSVYLREEVCAVSDHLASVSLFDSDEWMECLQHFEGWTESSEKAAKRSREHVSKLKLRSLHEPGDVESALLRNQIDEQYLRAMIRARAQLTGKGVTQEEKRTSKEPMRRRERVQNGSIKSSLSISSVDAEAPRPQHISTYNPKGRPGPSGPPRNQWQGYNPHHGWWQNGWQHHPPYPYGDDASVHSSISCDTGYSHGYMNGFNHGPVPPPPPQYYQPSMMYSQHQHHPMQGGHHGHGQYPSSAVPPNPPVYSADAYDPQHMDHSGWVSHPSMGPYPNHEIPGTPDGVPTELQDSSFTPEQVSQIEISEATQNPDESFDTHRTPYKPNPNHGIPMSPYWGHLQDHATLSMMGLSSPPGGAMPPTPHRTGDASVNLEEMSAADMKNNLNAQPLLVRQQYYGYGYGSREGYAPPSPATQFMMSPQASFAYNYGYGFSPARRTGSQTKLLNTSISEEEIDVLNGMPEGGNAISESSAPPSLLKHEREIHGDTDDVQAG
ncbi:hypothetical protein FRACYDRAFT_244552 [Fragilariopsis cylindrus CCMP1102]|uniref:Uncharacterized protein n=1 Tax=Fragilariopsis cylindrus CCMP1102 TaxID=635003 RepID=A0A1E7F2R4_9STRA|nr:hypothetical protein FRACYDRAFT_244552 [Fragilariopsis cylindrus CCMP1102]|eukprot:OEU12295.1 hypothetical protein FRACYDRAFT_244552 [Fragilariopsis cylindrus CCMP1102]